MNKRQYEIFTKLLSSTEIKMSCLTNEYGVSERTIRNDVHLLNCLTDVQPLIDIERGIVKVSTTGDYKKIISNLLVRSNYYEYKLSPKERKLIASLLILNNHKYTTVAYLADRISVSRNTILNEVSDIKKWFVECNLRLCSQPNKGLYLEAKESDVRNAMIKIIYSMDDIGSNSIFRCLVEREILSGLDREYIENLIKIEEKKNGLDLADFSFNSIVNYIIVVVNRMIKGKFTDYSSSKCRNQSKIYIAKNIMLALGEKYGFSANNNEINQLATQLLNCSYIRNVISEEEDSINLQMLVTGFIYEICKKLEIHNAINYDTYKFLIDHMENMTLRLKRNNCMVSPFMVNPFREELEKSYPAIFSVIREHIQSIEKVLGLTMGRNEISYIVMHIVAAIEKSKKIKLPIHAVIVCSTGLCTALLLQAKLKQRFDICVIDVISAHKLESYDLKNIDIIISTTLLECNTVNTVLINPMLYEDDILRIQKCMQQIISNKMKESDKNTDLIKRSADYAKDVSEAFKNSQKDAAFELAQINKKYSTPSSSVRYKSSSKFLCEIIEEDNVLLDISVANWREAIQQGGELLKKKGYIEQRYINKMINNVEVNGPYIVFIPGVAFAHASHRDGSKKLAISIVRLKKAVKFNHEINDPVKFIICLSVADNKSHLNAFFDLVKIIGNKEIFNIFNCANHPRDIIEVIRHLH